LVLSDRLKAALESYEAENLRFSAGQGPPWLSYINHWISYLALWKI